jgi:hypothetical protein
MIKILFVFFLYSSLAIGNVEVGLDPSSIEEGEYSTLSVVVTGSLDEDISLPEVGGLNIVGTGQSTSISIVNGSYSKNTTYSFSLSTDNRGIYKIPSFPIYVDGKTFMTPERKLHVGSSPKYNDTDTGDKTSRPPTFMTRKFSKYKGYLGEAILSTTKLYLRKELLGASVVGKKSSDFRYLELKQEETREELDGKLYRVVVLKKIMIPNRSGALTIPADKIRISIAEDRKRRGSRDMFFGFFDDIGRKVNKLLSTKEDKIIVEDIPKSSRDTSLIGSFTGSAKLSAKKLKSGETSTLTVTLQGRGALDSVAELPLSFPAHLKIYKDKPELEEKISDKGLFSKKTFKYALVPTKEGTLDLGKANLVYFDPDNKAFQSISLILGKIEVLPSSEKKSQVFMADSTKNEVKSKGSDLVDIHRNIDLSSNKFVFSNNKLLLLFILFLFNLLYLLWFCYKNFWGKDSNKRRKLKAYKNFKKNIKLAMAKKQEDENYLVMQYYDSYRFYLGDKFGTKGESLTPKDIDTYLNTLELGKNLLKDSKTISQTFDRLSFAGTVLEKNDQDRLKTMIDCIVKEIEKKC